MQPTTSFSISSHTTPFLNKLQTANCLLSDPLQYGILALSSLKELTTLLSASEPTSDSLKTSHIIPLRPSQGTKKISVEAVAKINFVFHQVVFSQLTQSIIHVSNQAICQETLAKAKGVIRHLFSLAELIHKARPRPLTGSSLSSLSEENRDFQHLLIRIKSEIEANHFPSDKVPRVLQETSLQHAFQYGFAACNHSFEQKESAFVKDPLTFFGHYFSMAAKAHSSWQERAKAVTQFLNLITEEVAKINKKLSSLTSQVNAKRALSLQRDILLFLKKYPHEAYDLILHGEPSELFPVEFLDARFKLDLDNLIKYRLDRQELCKCTFPPEMGYDPNHNLNPSVLAYAKNITHHQKAIDQFTSQIFQRTFIASLFGEFKACLAFEFNRYQNGSIQEQKIAFHRLNNLFPVLNNFLQKICSQFTFFLLEDDLPFLFKEIEEIQRSITPALQQLSESYRHAPLTTSLYYISDWKNIYYGAVTDSVIWKLYSDFKALYEQREQAARAPSLPPPKATGPSVAEPPSRTEPQAPTITSVEPATTCLSSPLTTASIGNDKNHFSEAIEDDLEAPTPSTAHTLNVEMIEDDSPPQEGLTLFASQIMARSSQITNSQLTDLAFVLEWEQRMRKKRQERRDSMQVDVLEAPSPQSTIEPPSPAVSQNPSLLMIAAQPFLLLGKAAWFLMRPVYLLISFITMPIFRLIWKTMKWAAQPLVFLGINRRSWRLITG